jgi:hypothetical protein
MKTLFLYALSAAILLGQAVAPVVADKFVPARYTAQRIDGLLGERMRINLEGRLLHVDEQEILDCFRHRPGKQGVLKRFGGSGWSATGKA